jgi:hypothetical protein
LIARGTKIRWRSDGPKSATVREGVVRGYLPPGRRLKLPKSADPAKCRVSQVNAIHARYLVEVPRRNARSGKKLASHWLAPKAKTLDKIAKTLD